MSIVFIVIEGVSKQKNQPRVIGNRQAENEKRLSGCRRPLPCPRREKRARSARSRRRRSQGRLSSAQPLPGPPVRLHDSLSPGHSPPTAARPIHLVQPGHRLCAKAGEAVGRRSQHRASTGQAQSRSVCRGGSSGSGYPASHLAPARGPSGDSPLSAQPPCAGRSSPLAAVSAGSTRRSGGSKQP